MTTIDRLIINLSYEEPVQHWRYNRETRLFDLEDSRRTSDYAVASPDSKAFDDPGIFVEIPLVNQIRPRVAARVKNDHLGFEILYVYRGVVRKYRPDFLVRLKSGDILVLETKGQDTEQDKVKRPYLNEWTQAVNAHGGFGR